MNQEPAELDKVIEIIAYISSGPPLFFNPKKSVTLVFVPKKSRSTILDHLGLEINYEKNLKNSFILV